MRTKTDEYNRARYKRRIVSSAVLNIGWVPQEGGDEWLRQGDYLNEMVHDVDIEVVQQTAFLPNMAPPLASPLIMAFTLFLELQSVQLHQSNMLAVVIFFI